MDLDRTFVVVVAAVGAINFFSPLPSLLQLPNTQSPSQTHTSPLPPPLSA